jgi:serine/threonine-protein kinase
MRSIVVAARAFAPRGDRFVRRSRRSRYGRLLRSLEAGRLSRSTSPRKIDVRNSRRLVVLKRRAVISGDRGVIGTVLNGRFALEKELGRGGMGAVYRGVDKILERSVAIKILKDLKGDDVVKKIRLEAQISARLLHENIVRLYDIGEAGGTYYLVMEEVDGTSFQRRRRKLSLGERFRIVAQTADALDYAHRQGVIHRDIKPANILLTSADQAKLSDFGLSMMAGDPKETGIVRGTPHYMSPEQAMGKPLDHRTDLYALGVILYECATDTLPFTGPPREVMGMHVTQSPDRPRRRNPRLSESVDELIMDLLAKDPGGRPPTGARAAAAIRDLIETDECLRLANVVELESGERIGSAIAVAAAIVDSSSNGAASAFMPAAGIAGEASAKAGSHVEAVRAVPQPASDEEGRSARALASFLIRLVEAEPIPLDADDRYRCGHYLAYLLGGSRRKGILGRRPLDERNADRARLLLAMASIVVQRGSEHSITLAASLLDRRPEVRPLLSPIVVAKYLAGRDGPQNRRSFRAWRAKLHQASEYAKEHMCDPNGALNPGLMPQTITDLERVAPPRTEIDDALVGRWNHVSNVWRNNASFREAVLRYATRSAHRDPASVDLWPEVVYPLIERARWQRQTRSKFEELWDNICGKILHVNDAGINLDHAIDAAVSRVVVDELDQSVVAFEIDPELDEEIGDEKDATEDRDIHRIKMKVDHASLDALEIDEKNRDKGTTRLARPEPIRLSLAELAELWREAYAKLTGGSPPASTSTDPAAKPRPPVAIGPYRLAVIATIRGRSAGQVAIQGMSNKQIEMIVPTLRDAIKKNKPALAIWLYADQSLAITHLDHRGEPRYILWHAPSARQINFDLAGELVKTLVRLGLDVPENLDQTLDPKFKPQNTS